MPYFLFYLFPWWGILLQALAIVHFIRRRPDGWWLWIIILGGGLGAIAYLLIEALPDLRQGGSFQFLPRRKRIHELEDEVQVNPSAGNLEELGDLYLQNGRLGRARACFDRAIASRADSLDPFYRRALCALGLGDTAAALPDLEKVVGKEPGYDFHRAAGLLAHAYALTGQPEKAGPLFERVTRVSTLTETQYHYAEFLAAQGQRQQARDWAERILAKKIGMPRFQKRRDRPWFRRTSALMLGLRRS